MLIATVDATKTGIFFHTSTLQKNVNPFIFKQKEIYICSNNSYYTHKYIFVYLYFYFIIKFFVKKYTFVNVSYIADYSY